MTQTARQETEGLRELLRTTQQDLRLANDTIHDKDELLDLCIAKAREDAITIATQRCQVADLKATLARLRGMRPDAG
jgi:hypothetical protein